jgi:hypothetical protein
MASDKAKHRHQARHSTLLHGTAGSLGMDVNELRRNYAYAGDDAQPDTAALAGARARGVIHLRQLQARRKPVT